MAVARIGKIVWDKATKRYKRNGRFVSASAFRSQQWRLRGGKAGTARRRTIQAETERIVRAEVGSPGAGKTWVQLASKYDRVREYVEEILEDQGFAY